MPEPPLGSAVAQGHSQFRPHGQQIGGSQGMILPLQALAGAGVRALAAAVATRASIRRMSFLRMRNLLGVEK